MAKTDRELFEAYARSRSEAAFRELVERHLDLVHSVARRVTLNDDLARDVSQNVFLLLATRPEKVPARIELIAWFHRTTHHKAIDLVRSENRRKRREQISCQEQEFAMNSDDLDWKELEPVLDSALDELPEADRALVLARFYQRRSHPATARELGISEDAARMRTKRALEKLRAVLKKRGITTTSVLLGTAVTANAIQPAPAGLGASICSSSMAAASATAAAAAGGATVFGVGKAYLAVLAAVAVGVPIIALQSNQNADLKKEIAQLEHQLLENREPGGAEPAVLSAIDQADRAASAESRRTLSEILATRDPLQRMRELVDYVERVDRSEIEKELYALRENTPEWDPDGKVAAQLMLKRWASADIDQALHYVSGLDHSTAVEEAAVVLSVLAADEPERAVRWLGDPENKLAKIEWMRDPLAGTIAKEWVRQDAEAAFDWADSISGAGRRGALIGVVGTLASTDPEQAATLAARLGAGGARAEVIAQVAQAWAERAPREAISWSTSLEGEDRARGIMEVLGTWAGNAPEEAAAYLAQLAGDHRQQFISSVGIPWGQQDPQAAANWLADQPEGEGRTLAMGAVMWNWTVADPRAASSWLVELPPGPSRDHAIGGLAKAAFDDDPQAAITWAASMDDPRVRAEALQLGVREWLKRDPAAANSWIETTDLLSEAEVRGLLDREE